MTDGRDPAFPSKYLREEPPAEMNFGVSIRAWPAAHAPPHPRYGSFTVEFEPDELERAARWAVRWADKVIEELNR